MVEYATGFGAADSKVSLYREAEAQEVWVVEQDGRVWFFAAEEREHSTLAPDFPRSA